MIDLPLIADHMHGLCLKDHQGPRLQMDFPPPGEGSIDHAAMFRILAGAGFAGPVMIERVDGREDAAAMAFDEIVQRYRARGRRCWRQPRPPALRSRNGDGPLRLSAQGHSAASL